MNRQSSLESTIIEKVKRRTKKGNHDNISRTNSYLRYFLLYPNIKWSFLASSVSRNAGWNMCDLESESFRNVLGPHIRKKLFLSYEKANWVIFQDAYPQLLLYHYSTKYSRPMFHLLRYFSVSPFMEMEWYRYWHKKDGARLLTSLIINEQNMIQKPVIAHPMYKKYVFSSMRFRLQQLFHFNVVLFPTLDGELYGSSVTKFQYVTHRIALGKYLSMILFHPLLFPHFFNFARKTPHTGSRYDYEQFVFPNKKRESPFLRMTYPIIHHTVHKEPMWTASKQKMSQWLQLDASEYHPRETIRLTNWYKTKRKQLRIGLKVADWLVP